MEQRKIEHITLHPHCFWYNRNHWCFKPVRPYFTMVKASSALPYSCSMLYCHWSNLSQSANSIQTTPFPNNRKMLYEI